MGAAGTMSDYEYDEDGNECQKGFKRIPPKWRIRRMVDRWVAGWLEWKKVQLLLKVSRDETKQATARELSERQWRLEAQRDIKALQKTVESLRGHRDPLAEAKKLLALIDDIVSQRDVSHYMIKSWQAEYREFKRR